METDFYIPLMKDPIQKDDILFLKSFLDENNIPRLSNGPQVELAEKMFCDWLGTRFCTAVNSGSSSNFITMQWIRNKFGQCSVIVPPLTWCSDWYAVLKAGLTPVTCDINLKNLSFDVEKLKKIITKDTKILFLTHVLGINALTKELLDIIKENNLILIEDVCESAGATFNKIKLGNFGYAANWSGFVAHHFSGIELGLITTNDEDFYEFSRSSRSHGMNRELKSNTTKQRNINNNPNLNKDFIFLDIAGNFRTTEISGTLLQSQLQKLDSNNQKRREKFQYFIERLDSTKYFTDFNLDGQCAYSFILILKEFNRDKWNKIEEALKSNRIEMRRGCSGGGSQLKQPYLKGFIQVDEKDFPVMEHIHFCSCYIGLYPDLEYEKIDRLLEILNNV